MIGLMDSGQKGRVVVREDYNAGGHAVVDDVEGEAYNCFTG